MARSGTNADAIGGLGKLAEVRQRLFVVLVAIVVFRIGTHLTIPGLNHQALADLYSQNSETILGMFNMFSGGALERMSVFALNIMPYISASIIMQLLSVTVPKFEQMKKEGDAGRRKITQYTRYGTLVLATVQSFFISIALQGQEGVVVNPGYNFVFTAMVTLVAGTIFLMWLGEQVTERGIGNGISIIIFAGIVSGLPGALAGTLSLASEGELEIYEVFFLIVMALGVTYFVVFMERGQRRITVNYAKRQQGRKMYGGQTSHLPLKINMAGVIPPIFASSIILFPSTIGQWLSGADAPLWLENAIQTLRPGQPIYVALYAAAIIFFCFFYTALVFNAKETADNLKRAGAFIPGIRPGEQTTKYIDGVMTRLTVAGAIYITSVCLLPEFLILWWNVPFYFGGTSLLIIVVVIMDFMAQLQAHMLSHQYEPLMKKANLKGHGRAGALR